MSEFVRDRETLSIGVVIPIDADDGRIAIPVYEKARAVFVEVRVLNSNAKVIRDLLYVDGQLKLSAFAEEM